VTERGRTPQSRAPRPGARTPEADGPPTDIYNEPIRPSDDRADDTDTTRSADGSHPTTRTRTRPSTQS